MGKAIFTAIAFSVFLTLTSGLSASAGISAEPYVYVNGDSSEATSYLGVDTRNLTPDMLAPLHLKNENGVEVTMVDQDAPAGKAGIKDHDVITTINGQLVESVEQLRRLIREIPPGRMITVGLSRDGQPLTVKALLASRKMAFDFHFDKNDFHFEMPAVPNLAAMDLPVSVVVVHSALRSGLMLESLTPQLGNYFGVTDGHGLLVRSVEKGSLADKAGFRAGDVIVRVNGQAVRDSSDFGFNLRSTKGNIATIVFLRDRKPQTITLKLPPRDQSCIRKESFTPPRISQEMRIDLGKISTEMAKLRPQIEAEVRQAQKATEQTKKEVLQNRGEWEKQAQEFRKQGEQIRQQMHEQEQNLQKELHANGLDI